MAKKYTSGSDRYKRGTHKPILVGATIAEHAKIRTAAAISGKPMTHFLLELGLAAAENILEKSQK
jgi:uncharacterized protein (DUF1778 family)